MKEWMHAVAEDQVTVLTHPAGDPIAASYQSSSTSLTLIFHPVLSFLLGFPFLDLFDLSGLSFVRRIHHFWGVSCRVLCRSLSASFPADLPSRCLRNRMILSVPRTQ